MTNRGRLAWLNGNCADAEEIWSKIIESNPGDQRNLLWLYWLSDEVKNKYLVSLIGEENLAGYIAWFGTQAKYANASDSAIDWYKLSYDLYPSPRIGVFLVNLYKQKDQNENAKIILVRMLDNHPPNSADYWWTKGQLAELEADWNSAVVAYIEGIKIADDPYDFYIRKAKTLERLDDLDGAEQSYRKSLDLRPDHTLGYIGLGGIERHQGNILAALEWFKEAEALDPDNFLPSFLIGELYFETGDYDEGIAFFKAALSKNPKHDKSLYYTAQIHHKKENINLALETLNVAIESSEFNRWQWVILLGDWYHEAGNDSKALETYLHADALNPGEPTIQERIAQIYESK
jgi:tetratricopeptide (TPR) repeat protein